MSEQESDAVIRRVAGIEAAKTGMRPLDAEYAIRGELEAIRRDPQNQPMNIVGRVDALEAAQATIASLKSRVAELVDQREDVDGYLRYIGELKAEIARLREALRFYADPDTWSEDGIAMDNVRAEFDPGDALNETGYTYDNDSGARARAVLTLPHGTP